MKKRRSEEKPKKKQPTKPDGRQLARDRTNIIKKKQLEYITKNQPFELKPRCEHDVGNMQIVMQCYMCEEWLPRDTDHFSANHGAANFDTCKPGHEWLFNKCMKCCSSPHVAKPKMKKAKNEKKPKIITNHRQIAIDRALSSHLLSLRYTSCAYPSGQ